LQQFSFLVYIYICCFITAEVAILCTVVLLINQSKEICIAPPTRVVDGGA